MFLCIVSSRLLLRLIQHIVAVDTPHITLMIVTEMCFDSVTVLCYGIADLAACHYLRLAVSISCRKKFMHCMVFAHSVLYIVETYKCVHECMC